MEMTFSQKIISFATLKILKPHTMMKKVLLMLATFSGLAVLAQKSAVESAAIYLRNSEMADAKKEIDAAAIHDETKNDPKMWFYRAAIYDTLYRNPEYAKILGPDGVEQFAVACKKCMETDTKKRYEYYCGYAIVNSGFATYNKAIEYSFDKDTKNAAKFFEYTLAVIPYDKGNDLKKNNINEKNILLGLADMHYKIAFPVDDEGNEVAVAKEVRNPAIDGMSNSLQKLIDIDYQDPIIYAFMAKGYFAKGDTAKGLSYIETGRSKFQTDKNLINTELNIYMIQGKQDVLLKKLNDALDADAENVTLLYVRGNVYDNYASNAVKHAKQARDTASALSKKAKGQTAPATKSKLDATAKGFNKLADSLSLLSKDYVAKAEADYKKVVELKDDYIDAYYNLGALNNNKTTEIVEKMNSISAPSQAEYDKKWNALKKDQDVILNVALGYFVKALEYTEALPETDASAKEYKIATMKSILYSMQQVYANLGNEQKTIETRKRRMELE
jgi:hypothetical protein